MSIQTVFYGSVINPQTLVTYQTLRNCLLAVSTTGQIQWIVEDVSEHMVRETMAGRGCGDAELIMLTEAELIIPGFIDTHTVCFLAFHIFLVIIDLIFCIRMHPK
jgi:guanine deaminase